MVKVRLPSGKVISMAEAIKSGQSGELIKDKKPLGVKRPTKGGGSVIVTSGGLVTERDPSGKLISRIQVAPKRVEKFVSKQAAKVESAQKRLVRQREIVRIAELQKPSRIAELQKPSVVQTVRPSVESVVSSQNVLLTMPSIKPRPVPTLVLPESVRLQREFFGGESAVPSRIEKQLEAVKPIPITEPSVFGVTPSMVERGVESFVADPRGVSLKVKEKFQQKFISGGEAVEFRSALKGDRAGVQALIQQPTSTPLDIVKDIAHDPIGFGIETALLGGAIKVVPPVVSRVRVALPEFAAEKVFSKVRTGFVDFSERGVFDIGKSGAIFRGGRRVSPKSKVQIRKESFGAARDPRVTDTADLFKISRGARGKKGFLRFEKLPTGQIGIEIGKRVRGKALPKGGEQVFRLGGDVIFRKGVQILQKPPSRVRFRTSQASEITTVRGAAKAFQGGLVGVTRASGATKFLTRQGAIAISKKVVPFSVGPQLLRSVGKQVSRRPPTIFKKPSTKVVERVPQRTIFGRTADVVKKDLRPKFVEEDVFIPVQAEKVVGGFRVGQRAKLFEGLERQKFSREAALTQEVLFVESAIDRSIGLLASRNIPKVIKPILVERGLVAGGALSSDLLVKSKSALALDTRLGQLTIIDSKVKLVSAIDSKVRLDTFSDVDVAVRSKSKVAQELVIGSVLAQDVIQKSKVKATTDIVLVSPSVVSPRPPSVPVPVIPSPVTPTFIPSSSVPISKPPRPPKTFKIPKSKSFFDFVPSISRVGDTSLFDVFVRRRGVAVRVGKGLGLVAARASLVGGLRGGLAASGFVVGRRGKVAVSELGLGGEFRKAVRDPFRVVQRRGFRLGTRAERVEIQKARKSSFFVGKAGGFL